ncbi:MAG TPA: Gfo/Idh/MocA family oxidoreductase [Blastocatellia bacterium]|nr:Gfo/Idh/MocA family oxidoreductase [Blastocatellia bacterium]
MKKVVWGVLGVAKIATQKVIPAMQRGEWSAVHAIASRDYQRAAASARALGIPQAYGSYEELLADPQVEAVYIPLPNHLHVPMTIQAAEAGKHVLCEKPIALTADEARQLIAVRDRTGRRIEEAFMVRAHPQWIATRDLVRQGRIGELRAVSAAFSYFNRDPQNIRNRVAYGGGALMDIGCYAVAMSRYLFQAAPRRVMALVERDHEMHVDRLTSAIMDFPEGQSVFTCSTQMVAYQRVQVFGTRGRIEIEIPFNAPPDRPTRILIDDGSSLFGEGVETVEFPIVDQYTIQGDLFSRAIREDAPARFPLEDAVQNMAIIDALFRSAAAQQWQTP